MFKNGKSLTILNVGDIHFIHPQTPTSLIVKNFQREIIRDEILSKIDLLFISGDVFDRQSTYDDPRVGEVETLISQLLWKCAEHNVVVRIVEGTPSHDWKQSRFFIRQAGMARIPVDIHYAEKLSIEKIESLGITVLYVPDKWNPTSTEDTLTEVKALLKLHGLKQVDFALMHGAFDYQLPAIVKEPSHNSDEYHAIVKHLIFIGHVHISMPRDRIVPSGSFDRLTHGEEGPKGFHIAKVDLSTGDFTLTFVENKKAKIYKTLDVETNNEQAIWAAAEKAVTDYPVGSSFCIRSKGSDAITKSINEIQKAYPDFQWKVLVEKSKKEKNEEMERALSEGTLVLPELTVDVIKNHVLEMIKAKGVDEDTIFKLTNKLQEAIDG